MAGGNGALVRRYWDVVWSKGDVTGVAEFYTPVFTLNGAPCTVEDFAVDVAWEFGVFPDLTATVDEVIEHDDRVVSRVTYRGTNTGRWRTLPAFGTAMTVMGLDLFRLADGMCVEHWHCVDHLDMFLQLGATLTRP